MNQVTKFGQLVGKTISEARPGLFENHYEALFLTFTDGDTAILVGGGYDGYGDYLELREEDRNSTDR